MKLEEKYGKGKVTKRRTLKLIKEGEGKRCE